MLIQRVIGGLGNQMFQYAFIKALALKRGCTFKLDLTPFDYYKTRPYELENFNIQKSYIIPFYKQWKINKFIKKFFRYLFYIKIHCLGYYQEKRKNDEFLMEFPGKNYFSGYRISYKFFENYTNEILKDFTPKRLSKNNTKIINKYKNKNTISVHIRRGDYLKTGNSHFVKLNDGNYYNQAINYFKKHIKNPFFLFFSDDIDYVKNNFKGKNYIYISSNTGKDSRQDMILMSNCKHNIIANSTFSFWGAYLNNNPKKIVIAPKEYIKGNDFFNTNIYPNSWLRF